MPLHQSVCSNLPGHAYPTVSCRSVKLYPAEWLQSRRMFLKHRSLFSICQFWVQLYPVEGGAAGFLVEVLVLLHLVLELIK